MAMIEHTTAPCLLGKSVLVSISKQLLSKSLITVPVSVWQSGNELSKGQIGYSRLQVAAGHQSQSFERGDPQINNSHMLQQPYSKHLAIEKAIAGQRSACVYVMRQTDRQTYTHENQTDRQTDIQTHEEHTDRHTDIQTHEEHTDRHTCAHMRSRQTEDMRTHRQQGNIRQVSASCLGHLNVHRPPFTAICGLQPFCSAQVLELNALPSVQPCLEDQLGGGGQGALQPVVVQGTGLSHCHPLCTSTS